MELPEARPYIAELKLFRLMQMMPLLFAAWKEWPRRDFVRTLKLACALHFRYTVVSRLNASDLEPVYHKASRAVAKGTARTPRIVRRSAATWRASSGRATHRVAFRDEPMQAEGEVGTVAEDTSGPWPN